MEYHQIMDQDGEEGERMMQKLPDAKAESVSIEGLRAHERFLAEVNAVWFRLRISRKRLIAYCRFLRHTEITHINQVQDVETCSRGSGRHLSMAASYRRRRVFGAG